MTRVDIMDELLDIAPCGFVVFDDDGRILEINATLLRLLGYERGELEGRHVETIMSVGTRIFYHTHFFPLLKLDGKAEEVYLLLRAKAGMDLPVLANASRRLQQDGPLNVCAVFPIKRRNEYEDEILQSRKAAEQANRLKDEFLATVSHELRTPLSAILGWIQVLRTGGADPERLERAIGAIERNARMQARLVEDLLDLSRISAGRVDLKLELVDPALFVNAAMESVRPVAEAKSVRLQVERVGATGKVQGDADRLQQVVWNLLTNAVKFTPSGGEIQVSMAEADGRVEITVKDNGMGIKPEFLPHVFERFRQADHASGKRHGGLGIGLSIVRNLVELHAGKVSVESAGEGKGTAFKLCLPLAQQADAPDSSAARGSANQGAGEAAPRGA